MWRNLLLVFALLLFFCPISVAQSVRLQQRGAEAKSWISDIDIRAQEKQKSSSSSNQPGIDTSSTVAERPKMDTSSTVAERPKMNWSVPAKAIPKVGSPDWTKEQEENDRNEQRLRRQIESICREC